MTGCQLDVAPVTNTLWALSASQFLMVKSAPVQAMSCQLFQEFTVGNGVKGLVEVQIDIHILSRIHQAGYLVIKGDQVGQRLVPFGTFQQTGCVLWHTGIIIAPELFRAVRVIPLFCHRLVSSAAKTIGIPSCRLVKPLHFLCSFLIWEP